MLILIGIIFLLFFELAMIRKIRLKENWDYTGYDYPRENPNALVQGESISGTVYSSTRETPGLGWIL